MPRPRPPGPLAALSLGLLLFTAVPTEATQLLTSAFGGRIRAVVIGINNYSGTNNGKPISSLKGSVNDARDLADALQRGGAEVYPPLLDNDATRDAIVAAMERLVNESGKGDLAVITYSGHGTRVPEYDFPNWKGLEPGGMNEEFVLGDYSSTGSGAREVIINKEMKAWLVRLDAKGVDTLLIADTCFGGGAVRGIDLRSAPLSERGIRGSHDRPERGRLKPIDMTLAELRANVADLPHVTFLAGADQLHEVPEVEIADAHDSSKRAVRGALSYAVARAFENGSPDSNDGAVTREQLFDKALSIARQYSNGRQQIDYEPRSPVAASRERPVFRIATGQPAPVVPAPATDVHLKLAILNGDGSALLALRDRAPPFEVVGRDQADLVWDLATGDVISRGDVIRHAAEPGDLPGVLIRMAAVMEIKRLSEAHVQKMQLDLGGRIYRPGSEHPTLRVMELGDRDLMVLNLASNGLIQMLWPGRSEQAFAGRPEWTYAPDVVPPFGADQAVAVTGRRGSLDKLAAWAWDHDQQPDAVVFATRLRDLMAGDPDVQLGTVDLVTQP